MRTVAVIPVRGRLPLLKHTVERLLNKNGCTAVVCVGDSIEEQAVCEDAGAEFIFHENNPLGKKWNAAFVAAKKYQPDAVLFMGSSDWVSDNWLPTLAPFIMSGKYDMIGKPDFYLLDIGETYRFCHWNGYVKKDRLKEPIGIGRVISKRVLDILNWRPIQETLNSSIDYSMYHRILGVQGRVELYKGDIQSLSISTNQWPNKHKFDEHYTNKIPSDRMPGFEKWLDEKFPEYKLIFNED